MYTHAHNSKINDYEYIIFWRYYIMTNNYRPPGIQLRYKPIVAEPTQIADRIEYFQNQHPEFQIVNVIPQGETIVTLEYCRKDEYLKAMEQDLGIPANNKTVNDYSKRDTAYNNYGREEERNRNNDSWPYPHTFYGENPNNNRKNTVVEPPKESKVVKSIKRIIDWFDED